MCPTPTASYWTWDITATRRFTGRWSLVAGFAHTWNRDQASGYFGQSVRENIYPLTPNDLINAGEDGRHEFRIWSAKIHGTYAGPWDVRITPFLRHQSGQPFGRTFVDGPELRRNVRILAEPIGTRRMDNITILDVRVEKGFRLGGHRRVAGFVDVFNLLNANPEQNTSWSSGSSFLRPLSIVPPRLARIGDEAGVVILYGRPNFLRRAAKRGSLRSPANSGYDSTIHNTVRFEKSQPVQRLERAVLVAKGGIDDREAVGIVLMLGG